jgi:protein-disulfide isomerase
MHVRQSLPRPTLAAPMPPASPLTTASAFADTARSLLARCAAAAGSVVALVVLPISTVSAQLADVTGLGFDVGAAGAPVAVVEFGDFGCSACAHFANETYASFSREFIMSGRVKFKYVPFVSGSFPNAEQATKAALCAADQSSYWPMHARLYENREWLRLRNPQQKFEELAAAVDLDMAKFRACYASDATKERIDTANRVARSLRIRGTPTFFINGREALGAIPIETWRQILSAGGPRSH